MNCEEYCYNANSNQRPDFVRIKKVSKTVFDCKCYSSGCIPEVYPCVKYFECQTNCGGLSGLCSNGYCDISPFYCCMQGVTENGCNGLMGFSDKKYLC